MRFTGLIVVVLALLLCATGCYDRVLPGIGFGPGGRIVEVSPEDLQAEAQRIVEEQTNLLLDEQWHAEAVIIGLPVEYADRPYRDRWSWPAATVQLTVYGIEGSEAPPASLDRLREVALETMRRATENEDEVSVTVRQRLLSQADYLRQRPTWLRLLHQQAGADSAAADGAAPVDRGS